MTEFQSKLKQLELGMRRKVLLQIARAGGSVLEKEIRSRAPQDTGRLREGIRTRTVGRESDIFVGTVSVAPHRHQFYSRFLEKGTKYMVPRPFVGPSFEAKKDDVLQAMRAKAIQIMNRLLRKGLVE